MPLRDRRRGPRSYSTRGSGRASAAACRGSPSAVQQTTTSAGGAIRRCSRANPTAALSPGDQATEVRCPTSNSPSTVRIGAPVGGSSYPAPPSTPPGAPAPSTSPPIFRATLEPRASSRATSSWPVKQPLVNDTVRSTSPTSAATVSYTHLRAHETVLDLV